MSLYGKSDLELISANWERLKEESELKRSELKIVPSKMDKLKIHNIIVSYIQEHKRKVYGGYALNLLMKKKNGKLIYNDSEIQDHDIDIYTPDPITDLKIICNTIFNSGFRYTNCSEAVHKETFTLRVDNLVYCDFTYVPKNIYNNMPFVVIENVCVIGPDFMTIDYLRQFTDPLTSWWRMDRDSNGEIKAFDRFYRLQKHYVFESPMKNYDIDLTTIEPLQKTIPVLDYIKKNILKKKSLVNIGFYAYNYFSKESKKYSSVKIPYYEAISVEYIQDSENIINELKKEFDNNDITFEEYCPFFQFFGYTVKIYYKKNLILIVRSHNNKATPYLEDNNIKIGTFQLTIMYYLMNLMYCRVNADMKNKNIIHSTISNMYDMRNTYLAEKNKSVLDNTPFKEFIIDTIGETMTLQRERQTEIERRRKNRESIVFRYDPTEETSKQLVEKTLYRFSNTSGNKIINEKNYMLFNNKVTVDDELIKEALGNSKYDFKLNEKITKPGIAIVSKITSFIYLGIGLY